MKQNNELLEMAKLGFEVQLAQIRQKIDEINAQLGTPAPRRGRKAKAEAAAATAPKAAKAGKRTMSAEGRAKIVAAAKKRWAAFHRAKKAKAAPKKAAKKASRKPKLVEAPAA